MSLLSPARGADKLVAKPQSWDMMCRDVEPTCTTRWHPIEVFPTAAKAEKSLRDRRRITAQQHTELEFYVRPVGARA